MALDINNTISGLENTNTTPQIGVEDVNSYSFNMSPEQQQVFDQQQAAKFTPATGQLPVTAYYPDINNRVAVGTYSGSQIGSATLFAPGGGLVPLGMLDARDLAVQKAALQKAKEVDDFMKKFQAPTSKLVNINENLTKGYFGELDKGWKQAMKASGGDANKAKYMLENNPQFNAKMKSYGDLAKYGDDIVLKTTQDEQEIRQGKFIPTDTYKATKEKLYKALNPDNPEFKNLADIYRTMELEREFSGAANQYIEKAVQQQLATAGINPDNPDYLSTFETTKKSFRPEDLDVMAEDAYNQFWRGSELYSKEKVKQNFKAMFGAVQEKRDVTATQKRAPGEGESDYSSATPISQAAFNTGLAKEGVPVGQIYTDKSYKTTADDEKKVINISLHKDNVDTKGNKIGEKAGQVEGTVSHVFKGFYDKVKNRFLSPEEVEELKSGKMRITHDIISKPAIMFTPKRDKDAEEGPSSGYLLDANQVKGKYPKKGMAKVGFDDKIIELEQEAEAENKTRKGTGWPTSITNTTPSAGGSGTTYKVKGKDYSESAIDKAAKASGMTRDQYLQAINK